MKYLKKGKFALIFVVSVLFVSIIPSLTASAYTEPYWVMSYLTSSSHYTDSSGKTWYPATAFYLPQFQTGVENADGKSTYYMTSMDGGNTWYPWENNHYVGTFLTPDNPPIPGYDFYYQFAGIVTNSDPQYNNVPYYSGKFYVDAKAPTVNFSPVSNAGSSQPINVVVGASDPGSASFSDDTGSGLNHYIYRTSSDNGSSWGAWSGNKTENTTVTFSQPGTYQIEVEAWDNVGNSSDWLSGSYVIDEMDAGGSVSDTGGQYHTNTDVITSVTVTNSGGDITPDTGAYVTFTIPGITSQSKNFVLPAGGSEPVWFKWHTPSTPQNVTASISISAGASGQSLNPTFSITDLTENTPPDPKGTDRANPYFQYETPPAISTTPSASWTTYSAHQEQRVGEIWNDSTKEFDTYTYTVWVFTTNSYYASLSATLKVTPDAHDPTAFLQNGIWTIKSGYGIQENVTTSINSNDLSDVTGAQNVVGYYPEFMYNDTGYDFGGYDRVLEMLSGGLNSTFDLKANRYSMFDSHSHFTPLWYANIPYEPTVLVADCYTPSGMLSVQSSDTVSIQGSVYDDWSILPGY